MNPKKRGTVSFAEVYEETQHLGNGAFGRVFKARKRVPLLHETPEVAVKEIFLSQKDKRIRQHQEREVDMLELLQPHVHVMELIDVFMEGTDRIYMIMELMQHDLGGIMDSKYALWLSPAQWKCYALQLAKGLEHMHSRGIMHRDLKPENILLTKEGVLKICDLGAACHERQPDAADPAKLTNPVTTRWYRPPEQLLGSRRYDSSTDVWSYGCILAEMLELQPLFPGDTELPHPMYPERDQLFLIWDLCGTPRENGWDPSALCHWKAVRPDTERVRQVYLGLGRNNKKLERHRFFTEAALNLLDQMLLQLDPAKRGRMTAVLQHPYFTVEEPAPLLVEQLLKFPPDASYFKKHTRRK